VLDDVVPEKLAVGGGLMPLSCGIPSAAPKPLKNITLGLIF